MNATEDKFARIKTSERADNRESGSRAEDALYEITNLIHGYSGRKVLDIAELSVKRGSALALVGPNGSGKSTFLRLLAFLDKPDQGRIKFNGTLGVNPRLEATLLLQEPYLLKRSVFENVVFGLRMRGIRDNLRPKAEEALAAVGFEPEKFINRQWRELSGGEKQRVALAARLVLKPLALLLDEPTSNLDNKSAAAIQEAVCEAVRNGATLITASHDQAWLEQLGASWFRFGE